MRGIGCWRSVQLAGLTGGVTEIVVGTIGTWGDVFPAVGLANGLIDAGHTVRVAASPSYRELVEGEGLSFSPIGPPLGFAEYAADPKILSGRLGGFAGFLHLFRQFFFPNLDRYVADLAESIRGADLLLAHPGLIAAPIAAEVAQVKWGTISVFPGLIPTSHSPPLATRIPSPPGSLGRAFHRMEWTAARMNMARVFDPPVNKTRRHSGLPPTSNSFFAPVACGGPYLILASPAVVDRPSDWPGQVQLTGFVTWDRLSSWHEPDGLSDFLSGPRAADPGHPGREFLTRSPKGFYENAAKAVEQLGHRALILTGPTRSRSISRATIASSAPRSPHCPSLPPTVELPFTTVASEPRWSSSKPAYPSSLSPEDTTSPKPRSASPSLGWRARFPGERPAHRTCAANSARSLPTSATARMQRPCKPSSPTKTDSLSQ